MRFNITCLSILLSTIKFSDFATSFESLNGRPFPHRNQTLQTKKQSQFHIIFNLTLTVRGDSDSCSLLLDARMSRMNSLFGICGFSQRISGERVMNEYIKSW